MNIRAAIRRCERAVSVYRDLGSREVLDRLRHKLYQQFGLRDPHYSQWEAEKEQRDIAFDRDNGVNTGGVQQIFEFRIVGSNARHGLCHIASDPDQFDAAMTALDRDLRQFSFVDFGSGKGRALLLARKYPFRRIIGIEFAEELHQSAQENFRTLHRTESVDPRIELLCADAIEHPVPDGPVIAYMFNPFGSVIVSRLAKKLKAACEVQRREIIVCYMNPVHGDRFLDEGWSLIADSGFHQCFSLQSR